MKILKIFGILVFALAALGLGLFVYVGGFRSVKITKADFKRSEIVYATHKGPYKNLSKSWSAFQKKWEAAGLKTCDSLGIYFDPPGTPEEKLRSVIACRIDKLSAEGKEKAREALPHFKLPATKALYASFPYKNVLSLFVGPTRVYPAMKKAAEAGNVSAALGIETYGVMQDTKEIGYYMPIEATRQDYEELLEAFK